MANKKISSKEKGSALERKFADFMLQELNYKEIKLNETVKGKVSKSFYEVDVLGKRLSAESETKMRNGRYLIFGGIILAALYLLEMLDINGDIFLIIGGLVVVGGLYYTYGKENLYEYVWVECKNLKSKVSRDHINKLNNSATDFHDSKDNEFAFAELIFVSESGYSSEALNFAENHNITCYIPDEKDGFKVLTRTLTNE